VEGDYFLTAEDAEGAEGCGSAVVPNDLVFLNDQFTVVLCGLCVLCGKAVLR
jgi:hypothetical protein